MPPIADIAGSTPREADAAVALTDASGALSHIAFALSDITYVFPGGGYAGNHEHLSSWALAHGKNAFGERGAVRVLETRSGAGGSIAGTLAAGQLASAVVSGSALDALTPSLASLVQNRLPGVLHVSARAGADHSDVRTAVSAARSAGAALLVSSSPQEAHDFALLAHVAALSTRTPVVHAVDAAAGSSEASVRLLRFYELAQLIEPASRPSKAAAPAKAKAQIVPFVPSPSTSANFARIMDAAAPALARAYAPFEYTGHASPLAVLAAVGCAGAVAADAAATLAAAGVRVGVVRILLAQPWGVEGFAQALPSSARAVAVFTVAASGDSSASGSLLSDVTASINSSSSSSSQQSSRAIHDVRWDAGEDFSSRHAEHLLRSVLEGAMGGAPFPKQVGLPAPGAPALQLHLTPEVPVEAGAMPLHRVAVWGLGAALAAPAFARGVLRVLATASMGNGAPASARTTLGACVHGASAQTLVSVGGSGSSVWDEGVDCALLSHPALFAQYDVLAPLRASGTLVFSIPPAVAPATEGDSPLAALDAVLSPEDKRLLLSRGVRVFAIRAADIANAGGDLPGREDLVLQTAYLAARGTLVFQRLAPLLEVQQRSSVAPERHAALVRMHARVRSGLLRVQLPSEWTAGASTASSPPTTRPFAPVGTASFPVPADAAAANSSTGLGPCEWVAHQPQASSDAVSLLPSSSVAQHRSAVMRLAFPEAFDSRVVLRPLDDDVTYAARVTLNKRLTPAGYDRNIFHLEMDISGTGLTYEIGSALGVYGRNMPEDVTALLELLDIDPNAIVTVEVEESGNSKAAPRVVLQSAFRLFEQDLDVFGKPGKDFYEALSHYATDPVQVALLKLIASDAGGAEFSARAEESVTYADLLKEFSSARPPLRALVSAIPRIKARHYSIASSMKMHPSSVHLLVVEVGWTSPKGVARHGQCSRYLAALVPGAIVAISVLPSEMLMPSDHASPIVMAGLGTGMAPFRAFIQERQYMASKGVAVGPVVLYFGARFRAQEYLYGDELDAASAAGLLRLRLAFSRDSASKTYIQHLMKEDALQLADYLHRSAGGSFYLCGPTWPEQDVEEAVTHAFMAHAGMDAPAATARIKELKALKRYVLEVY